MAFYCALGFLSRTSFVAAKPASSARLLPNWSASPVTVIPSRTRQSLTLSLPASDRPRSYAIVIYVNRIVLKRSALATTDTELKLMAAAAIIGLRRRWGEIGYKMPAAIGTPRAL